MLVLPLFLILLGYVIYPFYHIFLESFYVKEQFTLAGYNKFFDLAHPANLEALWTSVYISVSSVVLSGIVGVSLALLLERYNFPGRSILTVLAMVPLALPPLIGVYSFSFLFAESGIIPRTLKLWFHLQEVPFALKGIWGVLMVHTFTMYPYFYMTVSAAAKGLDPSLEEAASSLGAGRLYVWRRVILPMLTPAMIASSLLVFMVSMASYTAPLIFGIQRTMTMQIYLSRTNGNLDMAAVQSTILSAVSILFLLIMKWYQSRRSYQNLSKGVGVHRTEVSSAFAKYAAIVLSVLMIIILMLPLLVIILLSFGVDNAWTVQILPPKYTLSHYTDLFTNSKTWRPIGNSLKMSAIATTGLIIFGVAAAYASVRLKFRGRFLLDLLIMLPWALPGTVVAVSLISAFSLPSLFSFNQVLIGTFWIIPLAYFVRDLPLVFRSTSAMLMQTDPSVEEAARNLGASWWYSFRRVVFPMAFNGVLAGALLAFVQGIGEFVASILLYNSQTTPLSVAIYQRIYASEFGTACAYGVLQMVTIIIVLFISQKITGSQTGTIV
ncbi:iron ABC transporter permease [Paenibacillus thalictri]|uniref:Iron ABC transporter permease n=1 Tax=Paenibacillus thalictri TaxID=2527873 RepID=A0A4Q9DJB1_9BACL|nr:iron ABC transporter permease [Paenibacillus thalictri]